jgi:hypothetical protein
MINEAIVTNDLWLDQEAGERNKVLVHLRENKYQGVLDIGGAMGSWADQYVTAYLDCNSSEYLEGKTEASLFDGNISDPEGWVGILDHVHHMGKFDFAVCTQTLEDIRNPTYVLKMLPKVAKRGYIDIPSKYLELKRGNETPSDEDRVKWGLDGFIMGYTGHRWIINMVDNVLEFYPKLPFIEHLTGLEAITQKPDPKYMLCLWWEGDIPHRIVNDDFIGPNPYFVYKYYREGLLKGL